MELNNNKQIATAPLANQLKLSPTSGFLACLPKKTSGCVRKLSLVSFVVVAVMLAHNPVGLAAIILGGVTAGFFLRNEASLLRRYCFVSDITALLAQITNTPANDKETQPPLARTCYSKEVTKAFAGAEGNSLSGQDMLYTLKNALKTYDENYANDTTLFKTSTQIVSKYSAFKQEDFTNATNEFIKQNQATFTFIEKLKEIYEKHSDYNKIIKDLSLDLCKDSTELEAGDCPEDLLKLYTAHREASEKKGLSPGNAIFLLFLDVSERVDNRRCCDSYRQLCSAQRIMRELLDTPRMNVYDEGLRVSQVPEEKNPGLQKTGERDFKRRALYQHKLNHVVDSHNELLGTSNTLSLNDKKLLLSDIVEILRLINRVIDDDDTRNGRVSFRLSRKHSPAQRAFLKDKEVLGELITKVNRAQLVGTQTKYQTLHAFDTLAKVTISEHNEERTQRFKKNSHHLTCGIARRLKEITKRRALIAHEINSDSYIKTQSLGFDRSRNYGIAKSQCAEVASVGEASEVTDEAHGHAAKFAAALGLRKHIAERDDGDYGDTQEQIDGQDPHHIQILNEAGEETLLRIGLAKSVTQKPETLISIDNEKPIWVTTESLLSALQDPSKEIIETAGPTKALAEAKKVLKKDGQTGYFEDRDSELLIREATSAKKTVRFQGD